MGGSHPQSEAARREMGYRLHLLDHHQGMAWESRYDGCAEFDPPGPPGCGREDGQAVQPGAARGHPHGRDAQFLGPLDDGQDLLGVVAAYVDSDQPFAHRVEVFISKFLTQYSPAYRCSARLATSL